MVQTRHHRHEHIRALAPNRCVEDAIVVRVLAHHNLLDLQEKGDTYRLKPPFMVNGVLLFSIV